MGTDQERTQEPTPRYRAKIRASGQGPRSQFGTPALSILFAAALAYVLVQHATSWSYAFVAATRCAAFGTGLDVSGVLDCARAVGSLAGVPATIVFACGTAIATALIAAALSGAVTFAPLAVLPQLRRFSLAAGLKRLFTIDNLWQAAIAMLLLVLLFGSALGTAFASLAALATGLTLSEQVHLATQGFVTIWQRAAAIMVAFAVIDLLWARARFASTLRMTPRQLREDRAQTEARPEVKQRRKAVGARRSRSLRIEAIRKATAVVTNPTHVAVALRYAPPAIDVPVVVARGAQLTATIVRTVALYFDVPIIVSAELARALYARVDIDEPIPEDCYAAVAAIFAWIVRARGVLLGREDSRA